MLELSPNKQVLKMRCPAFNVDQPDELTGFGSRSVIVCDIDFSDPQSVKVLYSHHEVWEREAVIIPWKHKGSYTTRLTPVLAAVIRTAVEAEMIHAMNLTVQSREEA